MMILISTHCTSNRHANTILKGVLTLDKENKIEDWEPMFRQRFASSPNDISLDYMVNLTISLFRFRDLMKELPEEYRDGLAELDDDYYDLVTEASRAFYRLGYQDALQQQQNEQEGDR